MPPSQKLSSKPEIFVPYTQIFPSVDEMLSTKLSPTPPSSPLRQREGFAPPIAIFPGMDQILAASFPSTPRPSSRKQQTRFAPRVTTFPDIDEFFARSLSPTDLSTPPQTLPETPELGVCETNSISDSDDLGDSDNKDFPRLDLQLAGRTSTEMPQLAVVGTTWRSNSGCSPRRFLIPQWQLQANRLLPCSEPTGEKNSSLKVVRQASLPGKSMNTMMRLIECLEATITKEERGFELQK